MKENGFDPHSYDYPPTAPSSSPRQESEEATGQTTHIDKEFVSTKNEEEKEKYYELAWQLKIKEFIHDYIYKLSSMFFIPFLLAVTAAFFAYHSYMCFKLNEIYDEMYKTHAQSEIQQYQELAKRQEYINDLKNRIIRLEDELNNLRKENKKSVPIG